MVITLFELDARALGAGIFFSRVIFAYEDWERIYSLMALMG